MLAWPPHEGTRARGPARRRRPATLAHRSATGERARRPRSRPDGSGPAPAGPAAAAAGPAGPARGAGGRGPGGAAAARRARPRPLGRRGRPGRGRRAGPGDRWRPPPTWISRRPRPRRRSGSPWPPGCSRGTRTGAGTAATARDQQTPSRCWPPGTRRWPRSCDAEDLDGLATALYTVGGPVRMEALFEAYTAAARARRPQPEPGPGSAAPRTRPRRCRRALETLADLGVVELGTEESAGGLTVALSPLGVWGVHRRLRAQGWHVPVLGGARRDGAAGLLMTLASCDAEDGEAEIGSWLADRTPAQAAAELVEAAGQRLAGPARRRVRGAGPDRRARRPPRFGPRWPSRCCARTPRSGCTSTARKPSCGPRTGPGCWWTWARACWRRPTRGTWWPSCCPRCPPRPRPRSWPGCGGSSHPGVIDLLTALSEHHPDPAVAQGRAQGRVQGAVAGRKRRQDP